MSKSTYSTVLRIVKLHTDAELIAAGNHNLRLKEPPNADKSRSPANQVLVGAGKNPLELVSARVAELGIKPRSNAVRAFELVLTAGSPFFTKVKRDQWVAESLDFAYRKWGKENVVHVTLHLDESTPHLHPIVVPVVKADDKDGPKYKRRRKRQWKLDAKGIFESLAHLRPLGPEDKAAAMFQRGDLRDVAGLIQKLRDPSKPESYLVWNQFTPKAQKSLEDPKETLLKKSIILVKQLNKVIQGKPIFYGGQYAKERHSWPSTEQTTHQRDLIRLNRGVLDDAFPDEIAKNHGRRMGAASAPYMHLLQVEYFDLCKRLDPEVSEPLYKTHINHRELSAWNAARQKSVANNSPKIDLQLQPPSKNDAKDPGAYVTRELSRLTAQVNSALNPLVLKCANADMLQTELEGLKAGIREANRLHEQENLRLKNENTKLLDQLRTISLTEVMEKLGYPAQISGENSLYHLPDDRVISVKESRFFEHTSAGGLGKMHGRRAGGGAIDLTMFVTGWDLPTVRRWLANTFGVNQALASEQERVKIKLVEKIRPQLTPPPTEAEQKQYFQYSATTYEIDERRWPLVQKWLVDERNLDPVLIEKLHTQQKLWANSYGAVVFGKYLDDELKGATVHGTRPNPFTGKEFRQEIGPKSSGFTLGLIKTDTAVLVESPVEAISYYEIFGPQTYVISTGGSPAPELLARLTNKTAHSSGLLLLAFDNDRAGNQHSQIVEKALEGSAIRSMRQAPPAFHPRAKGWNDLLRASKSHLAYYTNLAAITVTQALETAKAWLKNCMRPIEPRQK